MIKLLSRLVRSSAERVREEHIVAKPYRLPASMQDLPVARRRKIEEMVILGVLMQLVAHADDDLSAKEEKAIERALLKEGSITPQESAIVIAAAREARESRPDIQGFTREVSRRPYVERIHVIEHLFHIALADDHLSPVELGQIRKIAGLFWISHKDFISAKIRVSEALGIRKESIES